MPTTKISDEEFQSRFGRLLLTLEGRIPTMQEIAKATGLSRGGVAHKMLKLKITREVRYKMG